MKDQHAASLGKKSWAKRKTYQDDAYFKELQKKSAAKRLANRAKLTPKA